MKKLVKIKLSSCFFLLIFLFIAIEVHAAPADGEVSFGLQAEEISSENEQIRRVSFDLKKGDNANPVCLTTSIEYDTRVYKAVQASDIMPSENLINKTINASCDSGIVRVSVGLENYNNQIIPDGNSFTIDFKQLPGVTPGEDSIDFNKDGTLGANQASTEEANLLTVVTDSGELLGGESSVGVADVATKEINSASHSCFINTINFKHNTEREEDLK